MPFTSTMRAWFNRTFRTSLSDPLSAGVDSEDYRGDEDETPARTGSASPTTAPAGSSATSPAFAPAGAAHRSRDFARLDEGDAPETGIAGPKKGDAGYGHNVALGVMDRWKALAGKNPYTEIFTGLSAAFGVLQDLPNSRLGPKAATSLRVFANTLPTLMAAANDAARALETALANLGTDKKTDKRQEDAARTLEAKLTALDTHVAKLGTVIQESIVSLQGEVIKQANSNVGKNYANLHPEAAAFFEDAATVAKVKGAL